MQTYTTTRLTDKQVLDLFDSLLEVNSEANCVLSIAGVSASYPDEMARDAFQVRGSHTLAGVVLQWPNGTIRVEFRRGLAKDEKEFASARTPSPYFDQIQVEGKRARNPQNQTVYPNAGTVMELCSLVERRLNIVEPSLLSEPAESASNVLNQTLAKLNERFVELNAEAERRRLEFEEEAKEKEAFFAKSVQQQEAALIEKETRLEAAYAARLEELGLREKALDDRDHMHVRRGLREAITKDVQEKLASALIPRTSLIYRLAVLLAAVAGACVSATFAVLAYSDFSAVFARQSLGAAEPTWTQTLTTWMLFGKGTLGSLAAFGFLVYAINWLRKSYNDDLKAHRDLERYAIDLNRASWAIETILEANSKEGVQIPDIMIQGVSRNLFGAEEKKEEAKSDALAELLRSSAKVRVGTDGAEFSINGRGAVKLAKELEE